MTSQGELPDIVERLLRALRSVAQQCGNVIYNCEQRPADNERHLASWRSVKEFAEGSLAEIDRLRATPPGSPLEREKIARIIFDDACGSRNWQNDFYAEEKAGCYRSADKIAALSSSPTEREGE